MAEERARGQCHDGDGLHDRPHSTPVGSGTIGAKTMQFLPDWPARFAGRRCCRCAGPPRSPASHTDSQVACAERAQAAWIFTAPEPRQTRALTRSQRARADCSTRNRATRAVWPASGNLAARYGIHPASRFVQTASQIHSTFAARLRAQVTVVTQSSILAHRAPDGVVRRVQRTLVLCCAALAVILAGASAAHAQTRGDRHLGSQRGHRDRWLPAVLRHGAGQLSVERGRGQSDLGAAGADAGHRPTTRRCVATTRTTSTGRRRREVAIDLASPTASITAVLQANNSALVTWSTTNAVSAVINGYAVGASGSTSP